MQRVLNFMRNPKLAHIFLFFKSWSCLFLICIWSCSLYGHDPQLSLYGHVSACEEGAGVPGSGGKTHSDHV